MNELISVIIPTYNRAHTIVCALNSVLNQTYDNLEIIIIDDASKDNTEEVVSKIKDSRVKYYRHKINQGGGAARNSGIRIAKGKYIAFQDSDDEWLSEKLRKQMTLFFSSSQEIGVVYSGFYYLKNGKQCYMPPKKIQKREGYLFDALLRGNFITTQSAVIRKECFDIAGFFDERLPRYQDWDLFLRLSKYYQFRIIDQPLVVVQFQKVSISSSESARVKALEIIINKYYKDFEENSLSSLSRKLGFLGRFYCMNNEISKGMLFLQKSISVFKFNFYSWCFLIALPILRFKKILKKT